MYCAKCGTQIDDSANFCRKCGAAVPSSAGQTRPPVTQVPALQSPQPVQTAKTNGFAIASLVLGIIGFFNFFAAVLAIIFGGVAMGQLNRNPEMKGRGLATAGLIVGIIAFVVRIIVAIWWGFNFMGIWFNGF